MKRTVLAFILSLVAAPVLAQQPPSPEMQAVGNKLMSEINAGLECSTMTITLRGQVDRLNAEVKRLKDKYEPAKPVEIAPEPEQPK